MKETLFKEVYGVLIDTKYAKLLEDEVVRVAMGAVARFCKRYGVEIIFTIKTKM